MTTQTAISGRPQASEYDSYWERYISLVSGEDILPVLEQQRRDTLLLLSGRSEEDGQLRYAAGKWSVKELVGHICDSERILAGMGMPGRGLQRAGTRAQRRGDGGTRRCTSRGGPDDRRD